MKRYLSPAVLRRALLCVACVVFATLLHIFYLRIDQEWNPDKRLLTLYHQGDVPVGFVETGNDLFACGLFAINQPWVFGLIVPIMLLFAAIYILIGVFEKAGEAPEGR
ncbi:hypothetical protein [Pelobacter propionicus]|uniref:Uncharacterized protein n=1 Tax=Pelobacter propionicus (strain DSM 2379 / NBRC 103807 / OttBd1) TaxID=338966 RepID=A1ATQ6_PELPD|nr:hypothetical protein [Pelobacter propionicus]ABL00727.1 hypothetical protein Ppro_3133 [Pelobacter propionicus DSM 2379]